MTLEVFWGSGSAFSWRVLLALEWKRLPWQSRLLEFSKGEHKTPEYLALNPRGQVPTVRDGDVVVHESIAILAYLDRRYPVAPLFGTSPQEAAAIWQEVQQCVCYLDEPTESFILPIYRGRTEANEGQIRAAIPRLHAELSRMEGALRARPFLVGSAVTAADLVAYPMVKSIARAAAKPDAARFDTARVAPAAERFPSLAAWMGRIEALPGYDRTRPPHWRD